MKSRFRDVKDFRLLSDTYAIGDKTINFDVKPASFVHDMFKICEHAKKGPMLLVNALNMIQESHITNIVLEYFPLKRPDWILEKRMVTTGTDASLMTSIQTEMKLNSSSHSFELLIMWQFLRIALPGVFKADRPFTVTQLFINRLDVSYESFIRSFKSYTLSNQIMSNVDFVKAFKTLSEKLPKTNEELVTRIYDATKEISRVIQLKSEHNSIEKDFKGFLADLYLLNEDRYDETSFYEDGIEDGVTQDIANFNIWSYKHKGEKVTSGRVKALIANLEKYFASSPRYDYKWLLEVPSWYECVEESRVNNNAPSIVIFDRALKRDPIASTIHLRLLVNHTVVGGGQYIQLKPTNVMPVAELSSMLTSSVVELRDELRSRLLGTIIEDRTSTPTFCRTIFPFALDSEEAILLAAAMSKRIRFDVSESSGLNFVEFEYEFFEYHDLFLRSVERNSALGNLMRTSSPLSVLVLSKNRPSGVGYPLKQEKNVAALTHEDAIIGGVSALEFLKTLNAEFRGSLIVDPVAQDDGKPKLMGVHSNIAIERLLNVDGDIDLSQYVMITDVKDTYFATYKQVMHHTVMDAFQDITPKFSERKDSVTTSLIAANIKNCLKFPLFRTMIAEFLSYHGISMIFRSTDQVIHNVSIAALNILCLLESNFGKTNPVEYHHLISRLSNFELTLNELEYLSSAIEPKTWVINNSTRKRGM